MRLTRRLVEVVVTVAADHETGLHLIEKSKNDDIFQQSYQAFITATISESRAVFVYHSPQIDEFYPVSVKLGSIRESEENDSVLPLPIINSGRSHRKAEILKTISESAKPGNSPNLFERRGSARPSVVSMALKDNVEESDESNSTESLHKIKQRLHLRRLSQQHYSTQKTNASQKQHETQTSSSKATTQQNISSETIAGLPELCFPGGLKILPGQAENAPKLKSRAHVHHMVLTDLTGQRLYATSLTTFKPFYMVLNVNVKDNFYPLRLSDKVEKKNNCGEDDIMIPVLVPVCVLLISKMPLYTAMRQCLSSFYGACTKETDWLGELQLLKQFSACVTQTPVPPLGANILKINLFNYTIRLPPPIPNLDKIVDFDVTILFKCLSTADILNLVICLLCQQRLVFVANCTSTITLAMETLMLLVEPFKWKFPYVPNLTATLLEFLDAPGPYCFGCHVNHIMEVKEADDIIIINLDSGSVDYQTFEVPLIPEEAKEKLLSKLGLIKHSFDMNMLSKLEPLNLEELNDYKSKFHLENQTLILNSFMDFMVSVFRPTLSFLFKDEMIFDRKNFLKCNKKFSTFYKACIDTETFDSFLRDRNRKRRLLDDWNARENQSIVSHRKISAYAPTNERRQSNDSYDIVLTMQNQWKETPDVLQNEIENEVFTLPSYFDASGTHFLERCCDMFSDMIKNKVNKSAALLLRSDIHKALGRKMRCLKDLYELSQTNYNMMNKSEVHVIIKSFKSSELDIAKKEDFFNKLMLIVESDFLMEESHNEDFGSIKKVFQLPEEALIQTSFNNLLESAEITSDNRLQERLFNALTLSRKRSLCSSDCFMVDRETFITFYECWNEVLDDLKKEIIDSKFLTPTELVLKISQLVRIDPLGSGRIGLTQERLLFLPQGKMNETEVMCELKNITKIEKVFQAFRRQSQMAALKITVCNPLDSTINCYVMWLKENLDCWFTQLTELNAAITIGTKTKNRSLIKDAITEVLLIDAVVRCASATTLALSANVSDALEALVHFEKEVGQLQKRNVSTTLSALQLTFEPTASECVDRSTIEALLFESASNDNGNRMSLARSRFFDCPTTNRSNHRLWVACSVRQVGYLLIFNMDTLEKESEVLSIPSKIICVQKVSKEEIWVAGYSGKIQVVDFQKMSIIAELVAQKEPLLCLASNEKLVASGSSDGRVVLWDRVTRKILHNWVAPSIVNSLQSIDAIAMAFINEKQHIFCCVRDAIIECSVEGYLITTMQYLCNSNNIQEMRMQFSTFVLNEDFVIAGCNKSAILVCFSRADGKLHSVHYVNEQYTADSKKCGQCCVESSSCRGISKLLLSSDQRSLWIGCKDGNLLLWKIPTLEDATCSEVQYCLNAHLDAVQSLCMGLDGEIFSGARSNDGKIAHWRLPEGENNNLFYCNPKDWDIVDQDV